MKTPHILLTNFMSFDFCRKDALLTESHSHFSQLDIY